jgi:hypothetical protein
VPVPCFLLFLCFKKATQEIFLELDKTKAEVPIFSDTRRSPKQRWRGGAGTSHTLGRRGQPLARATRGCDPLVHFLTPSLRLYILLDEKTLKGRSIFQKHITSHHHRRPEIGRVQKLFLATCRRGESPPEAFFITMHASGVMCE